MDDDKQPAQDKAPSPPKPTRPDPSISEKRGATDADHRR